MLCYVMLCYDQTISDDLQLSSRLLYRLQLCVILIFVYASATYGTRYSSQLYISYVLR